MNLEQELEELEREFWLGDARHYRAKLAPEAVMIFPEPVGIMDRDAIITSIAEAPRWTKVGISEVRLNRLSHEAVGFVYRAEAYRGIGEPPYTAFCTSVYVREEGGWQMALHQQTPIL